MAKQKKTNESTGKRSGGGYVYNPLATCLKVAKAVADHGGDRIAVPRAVVAGEIGADAGSSVFAQLLVSSKTWGLVEGNAALTLTEAGRELFFPTSHEATRMASLSILAAPTVFRKLIDQFDGGKLPLVPMLANILRRSGDVAEAWCPRVAQFFTSSAQELGVLDAAGFLRYSVAMHSAQRALPHQDMAVNTRAATEASTAPPVKQADRGSELQIQAAEMQVSGNDRNAWVYSEAGGTVRLETPDPLPKALWQRLKKYVEMLEPTE